MPRLAIGAFFLYCVASLPTASHLVSQVPNNVGAHQKISSTDGSFQGPLSNDDWFGGSVASLGDLDGDGTVDLAVGEANDDDSDGGAGALWILFLNADGTVNGQQKINETVGGFTGILDTSDRFGTSVACLGDLDGDGVQDLAVGAFGDDDGGTGHGAVWILFMNANGTVKSHQKISDTQGGFTGDLDERDLFGVAVAGLGDLDGDGRVDLAVGALYDDDGGLDRGAVWVLFLNGDGTVRAHQKISAVQGGFAGGLDDRDSFGSSLAALGDLDGDGVPDLAVGALYDDWPPDLDGAVWILRLKPDGTVKGHTKLDSGQGGMAFLDDYDFFGGSLACLGDVDGDGTQDLCAGAYGDDDGGPPDIEGRGAIWLLYLQPDGSIKEHHKISDTRGRFLGELDAADFFGASVTSLGDLDGDGFTDLAVGAAYDDDGGIDRGAVWILFMGGTGGPTAREARTPPLPAGGMGFPLVDAGKAADHLAGIPILVLSTEPCLITGGWVHLDPGRVLSVLAGPSAISAARRAGLGATPRRLQLHEDQVYIQEFLILADPLLGAPFAALTSD